MICAAGVDRGKRRAHAPLRWGGGGMQARKVPHRSAAACSHLPGMPLSDEAPPPVLVPTTTVSLYGSHWLWKSSGFAVLCKCELKHSSHALPREPAKPSAEDGSWILQPSKLSQNCELGSGAKTLCVFLFTSNYAIPWMASKNHRSPLGELDGSGRQRTCG